MPIDVYDNSNEPPADDAAAASSERPYVGILFECCGIYARIYRQPHARRYAGRCPKCLRMLELRVGRDGVDARFFRAS